jgi:hypothetical protein
LSDELTPGTQDPFTWTTRSGELQLQFAGSSLVQTEILAIPQRLVMHLADILVVLTDILHVIIDTVFVQQTGTLNTIHRLVVLKLSNEIKEKSLMAINVTTTTLREASRTCTTG